MSVKQAIKDLMRKDLVPDEFAKLIQLARQVTIPAMSVPTVMVTDDETGTMCVNTHPNLNMLGIALAAK